MKKLLCIILSLLMVLSVSTIAFAADDEEEEKDLAQTLSEKIVSDSFINAFNGKTLDIPDSLKESNGKFDIDKLLRNHSLDNVKFLGMELSYLYSRYEYALDWGHMDVSKSDMANLWGEMNTYIVSYLKPAYTNVDRLCTASHATGICNFIGHLLNPNFQNKTITFSTSFVNKKDFYTTISNQSGLTDAIINGWLTTKDVGGKTVYEPKQGLNYHPFLISLLNVPIYNVDGTGGTTELYEYFTVPAKEYMVPAELGAFMIKSVVENGINDGPIQYLMNILKRFVSGYTFDLFDAVAGLLTAKINAGCVTKEQLKDFDVLFNTLANDNNPSKTDRLQFVLFPAYQISRAKDNTEIFLFLMTYTNLLGKHQNNGARVSAWKTALRNSSEFKHQAQKDNTIYMIDAMFLGDLTQLAKQMRSMAEENINHIPSNWGWNIGDFFARLYRSIAMFFDGIFRTLKNGINLDIFG